MDRRLDEESHEPQLDAVLLFEAVLVAAAKLDDRRHVHFVERGEDRGGRLRLHQSLGDTLAQPRHRNTLLGPRAEIRRKLDGRKRLRPRRLGRGLRHGPRAAAFRFRRRLHVGLGDPPSAARPRHVGRSYILLGHHLARGRKRRCRRWRARRRRRCAGRAGGRR